MYVTDLTGDTTDDGSTDLENDNENTAICVTPNKSSIRKSREKLEIAIARPSIYEKQSLSIFNAPKDWKTISQYHIHAFPYYFNNLEREGPNTDKVSICESTKTVTPMKDNTSCKTSYIFEHVILKDISYLLFNSQFKALYDYSRFVSDTSPELIQYLDVEHEDMSYQVRFNVKIKGI